MPQLRPSWQLSFTVAGLLLAAWAVGLLVLRRRPDRAPRGSAVAVAFAREFAVVLSLLGLWQWVGAFVHTRVAGAMERGRAVHTWEAAWHLPSERSVQAAVDAVPGLMPAADVYYAYAHLNGTGVFVVWLWWRHRDVYPLARNVIIFSTLACLLVQVVPVAPPRLLPDLGFVDTALRDGHSVYGAFGSGMANQLAAMPSVHVGWAVIVAAYVWRAAPRRWRWIGPGHAVITVLVVVATGNHWWLDGLVASAFVALAAAAPAGLRALRGRWGVRVSAVSRASRRPCGARIGA